MTKFAGGSGTPSTSRRTGVKLPARSSRHTPPSSPRFAIRNAPSGVSATAFGRKSIEPEAARHDAVRPSARTTVTPPGHSGTNPSPDRVGTTHSGRCSPDPKGSSASGVNGRVVRIDTEFDNVYD